jgi:hypothetical protein
MDNKNSPAFPVLSKRELIAARIDVSKDFENYSAAFFTELMGKQPPSGHLENYAYWNKAEAKLRVMKADALLNELSKTQP